MTKPDSRIEAGIPPPPADTEASRDWWRRVFDAADRSYDLDADERMLFLEQCSAEDPALAEELKSLLSSGEAASPLDASATEFAAPLFELGSERDATHPQSWFGPYRIIREIGRGGMGAVYMAERSDDQYQKRVALKILPTWSASDDRRLHRFVEERQILARLDHPNIARLLDGGITSEGLPWFAMELVEGVRIDEYCDELRLPIELRLELFCQVCAAVQYAHRNLVVHRDLKPANILVTNEGRVRLLDFGIAKLLGDDATSPELTITSERLFTPLYASPEQISGEPISTVSDVYTLGVLLNVLLTGRYPYRLSSREHHEVARAVLEQEPLRPSLMVLRNGGSLKTGVTSEQVAAARHTTEPRLRRQIQGDLDAIVLKAIDKEPGRRYATAEQMETDVRRYLTGQPVLARPDSRFYNARKFVRRHRAGVAMTAAAAVLVLSFAAVMTVQRSRIRAQAERIAVERDRAEQAGEFFMNTFRKVTPGEFGITAREILDSAAASVDRQRNARPAQSAALMLEMARTYHRLELHDRARNLLEVSLALRRGLEPRPTLDIAETLELLGAVLLAQNRAKPAEKAYSEALVLRRREQGARHGDVARALVGLSTVLRAERRFPEAERLSREAVDIDRSRRGDARADLAQSTAALAHVLLDKGDHRVAAPLFRQALALTRETHPEEHSEVAGALFDLASALHAAGDHNAGDSLIQYAIGLQRRLVTAALLSGTADVSTPSNARAPGETAPVERAFAERSVAPTSAPEALAADNSRIVFASDRHGPDARGDHGNSEIYTMKPDGSDQRRLTFDKAADDGASWSPDGRRIAFHSQRGGGLDIWVMNADGTGQRRLTNFTERGVGAMNAHWSPDGNRIVFRSRVKDVDLYIINADGTGLTRITNDAAEEATPSWSPDGLRIAFTRQENGHLLIYVMDADGRNVVRLTSDGHHPEWSPDGRRIAFHSKRDGDQEIYVMNADGTNQVRLTRNPGEDGHASWSPDGRRIVFHRRVLGHVQIHVMNADGTNVRRLTDLSSVAFNGFPSWGPARR